MKLISSEKLKKNYRECIELYNIVGGLYSDIGSYDEAAHYHGEAHKICKTIGDRQLTSVTFRYMGEAQAALGNFREAIEHCKRYLELAEKLNNKVEVQRAWTTLGRVYLMQAQELRDKSTVVDGQTKELAREAERRFQRALTLADSVRDQVEEKEYAQMISGLFMNLGLINDICGKHQEAVAKFNRAIETCRGARIKEDLYRCELVLAGVHRQRNDIKNAVKLAEEALRTARSIGKKLLICEALIERGLTRLCQRDFKNAKRTFARAYLEKSPNEEEHLKAIRLTKLSHLINENYERICRSETAGQARLASCDKLGDLFVAVGNYKLAVEFYRRAFSDAKVLRRPREELARLLYSIAETYADDGQFKQALLCYEKELSYRSGASSSAKERCQSLIKMAQMRECLDEGEPEQVAELYERAYEAAKDQAKLMHQTLKHYVAFMKQKSFNATRCRQLEETLLNLASYPEVAAAAAEEEQEGAEEALGEELEDEVANVDDVITDDEDDDQVIMVGRRRANQASKFKQNEVGDTPLHEAAIRGDLRRVRSLIAQGHEINPRDNAGWIPLHEACNHGHFEVAEVLIEHGADVNNRGMRGMTPLHDAATNGHMDIMRLLMQNNANVIALTDSGETVLNCFRDYRQRNYKNLTNEMGSEFRQMEAELLNSMDKSGFNLMESAGTSGGSAAAKSSLRSDTTPCHTSSKAASAQRAEPRAMAHDGLAAKPVSDYRQAMESLKRKRSALDECAPIQKRPQPAVLVGAPGSISTKNWLAEDTFVEQIESDEEVEQVGEPESEQVGTASGASKASHAAGARRRQIRSPLLFSSDEDDDDDDHHQHSAPPSPRARLGLSDDDDDDDDIVVLAEKSGPAAGERELALSSPPPPPSGSASAKQRQARKQTGRRSHSGQPDARAPSAPLALFEQPLEVLIDGRLLLVPSKHGRTTIGELKRSIVERFAIVCNSLRPTIELAARKRPNCHLFDADLCSEVLAGRRLLAEVVEWNLASIERSYELECERLELALKDHLRLELRSLDEQQSRAGPKAAGPVRLRWAHVRLPRAHLEPSLKALGRRPIQSADLQGCGQLFECCGQIAQESLLLSGCLLTWRQLTELSLKCTGMAREHFELLCNSAGGADDDQDQVDESEEEEEESEAEARDQRRATVSSEQPEGSSDGGAIIEERRGGGGGAKSSRRKQPAPACHLCRERLRRARLPELRTADLSFNSIAYTAEWEFAAQVRRLRQRVAPKLAKLDLRANHLRFVARSERDDYALPADCCCCSAAAAAAAALQVFVADQSASTVFAGARAATD